MYKAIVTPLVNVRPHPNADRLQLAVAAGFQVIVGLDSSEGELGVFFPTDGQLSDEFCKNNNLYPIVNESGVRIGGGFIERSNRRVRAQSFRGQKSFGFWCPIKYFEYTDAVHNLVTGLTFTEINGYAICNRYETEETIRRQNLGKKRTKRFESVMFKKHFDTEQMKYNWGNLQSGELITITEKLHGTSGRYGRVLREVPLNRWQKVAISVASALASVSLTPSQWDYFHGTRNVILENNLSGGFYGDNTFRTEVIQSLTGNLHKGETVYFEIVGFVNSHTPIMPAVNTGELRDKDFTSRYGKDMIYRYGMPDGMRKMFVYRITTTNTDGISIDLTWPQVKERCNQLNLSYVPELVPPFIYDGNIEQLQELVEALTTGESTIDASHIREGVCIRVDGSDTRIYKNKSFEFYILEGVYKNNDVVDIEEAS